MPRRNPERTTTSDGVKVSLNPLFRQVSVQRLRAVAIELAPYLRPVRRELWAAIACSIGVVITAIARPWPIKLVFDYALLPDQRVKWVFPYALLKGYGPMGVATVACALLLVISMLWGLFTYLQRYLIASAGQRVTYGIRRRLFAHLQRLSIGFHRSQRMGDLLLRTTGDVNMMREMFVDAVVIIFSEGLVLVSMLVVMLFLDWQLTMVAIAVLPLLAVSVFRISRDLRHAVRKNRQREGKVAALVGEMLQAITVIQVFGREEYEEEKFLSSNRRNLNQGLRTVRLEAKLERVSEVMIALGTGGVLWMGVARVMSGILTPGDLIVFTTYLSSMYRPLRRVARVTGRLSKATVCAERVLTVLHADDRVKTRSDAPPAPRLAGRVTFKHVTFAYSRGTPVLKDVSFSVRPGKTVALVGPNGAGKSTLCGMLPRLFDPDEGAITVDGEKINRYRLDSIREQIGVVLQQSLLFEGSIASNIAYGKPDATREEIEAAARLADAHDFIAALPAGYDTHVGERGDTLSGGQRQKIAIARAMIKQPSVLVLDEPTASLDASSAAQLNRTLVRVAAGKTTFRVGHRLAELQHSDMIVVIEDGRVSQTGTHQDLMKQGGWYADVYRLQAGEGRAAAESIVDRSLEPAATDLAETRAVTVE
jgi:ABC-type multidrug transport system fused ATPase/permease subunit